jgi:transposase-like protein
MGRPCKGPNLVDGLDGSAEARTRLRIVLETIAGQRTVAEACAALGIQEAAFHKMRDKALAGAMAGLEPGTPGRPRHEDPPEAALIRKLEKENLDLKIDLRASQIREEIAVMMPHLLVRNESQVQKKRSRG